MWFTSSGFVCWSFGSNWWAREHLDILAARRPSNQASKYQFWNTWKALRSRKTRSYASLGGNRFKASRTVSDSSGMRSSALEFRRVSSSFPMGTEHRYAKTPNNVGPWKLRLSISRIRWTVDYLRPSFLYPAASAYQLANGIIQRFSHGLFMMYPASDGADMIADGWRWGELRSIRGWDLGCFEKKLRKGYYCTCVTLPVARR